MAAEVPAVGSRNCAQEHDGNLHGNRAVPVVSDQGVYKLLFRLVPDALLPGKHTAQPDEHRVHVAHLRLYSHNKSNRFTPLQKMDDEGL